MISANICGQCGGVKRIDWTISFEECQPVEMRFDPASLANYWRLCPGHPEPVSKHDGQLNEEGTHNVYPNNFNGIGISGEGGTIGLPAKEALSLLAWLKQEEDNLHKMAEQGEL